MRNAITPPWPPEATALYSAEMAAKSMRRTLLGTRRWTAPLRDMDVVAAVARAEIREADLGVTSGGCEALLIPLAPDRFRITVDPRPPTGWGGRGAHMVADTKRQRTRFRVAHELGHTLFYSRAALSRPTRRGRASANEERFCDLFAEALLLPEEVAVTCGEPQTLLRVQRDYDVSLEVCLRAYARVSGGEIALLYWEGSRDASVQWTNIADMERVRAIVTPLRRGRLGTAPETVAARWSLVMPERRQAVVAW